LYKSVSTSKIGFYPLKPISLNIYIRSSVRLAFIFQKSLCNRSLHTLSLVYLKSKLFKMKSTSFVLALAASANAAVVARDAQTILSDISSINTQVQSLTSSVNGYSSIADAAPLIASEGSLESAIKQGTSDASSAGSITSADADSVLTAVKSLIPNIVAALNAVLSKSSAFESTGVSSVVSGDITSLSSETDQFAAALVAIAPEDTQAAASAAVACLDAAFGMCS
jgi:hypothetical protein